MALRLYPAKHLLIFKHTLNKTSAGRTACGTFSRRQQTAMS